MYGYGYSLYNRLAFLGGLDPNASAFLTATGITDPTITNAVNSLCIDLKKYGVWDKMKAIYPFVGGTATTHKFNLKDSRDLNAAFRLSFSGGWTHSSNGATPNGTNGYANTFFNPSVNLTASSSHATFYSRTNFAPASPADKCFYGVLKNPNYFIADLYLSNYTTGYTHSGSVTYNALNTGSTGLIMVKNVGGTQKFLRNNTTIHTSTPLSAYANDNIYLNALNNNGISVINYSPYQCAFASFGDGLTDDEASNLYYSVQKFQTTLGRQVGTPIYSSNATDVNARLFLGATNIQDATITSAVDTLVQGLKTDGVWSKLKAVYPFVGGTATTHKFNLANALDEDTSFRLAFSGGWTHSSNGALPNGTNGYANTFLNLKTILNVNSHSFGIYSRTQDVSVPAKLYGCFTGSNYLQNNVSVGDFISGAISNQLLYTPSPTTGLMLASRTTSTLFKAFRNNILLGSKTTNVVDIPTANFYFGARNENNITQASYNPYQHAFAFLGDGLTDTEASNLYTRVQAFQTTLNRQV
jgi:hypothetical protein